MMLSRCAVLLLALVAFAIAADPFSKTLTFADVGGKDMGFPNQQLQTPNVAGPVTVTVISMLEEVEICAQLFTASHPPLDTNCGGAFVKTENETNKPTELQFNRKSFSSFANNKRLSSRFVGSARYALEAGADEPYTLNLLPNSVYVITVFSSDGRDAGEQVSVQFNSPTCDAGQYGPKCITPTPLVEGANPAVPVPTGQTAYFSYSTTGSWSNVTFAGTKDDFTVMFRLGALPDELTQFAFPKFQVQNNRNDKSYQVVGATSMNQPWIIAVQNDDADTLTFNITTEAVDCPQNQFGWNCTGDETAITTISTSNPNVTHVEIDDDDDVKNTWTYYKIALDNNVPAGADIVRFSLVSDKGSKSAGVYARWGAAPDLSTFNLNATRNYVNQLLLPINGVESFESEEGFDNAWYIGVWNNGHGYSFWVGENCQNNCSGQVACQCAAGADGKCDENSIWQSATKGTDSYGRCPCTDTKKDNFDCSDGIQSSSKPFPTIFIVLIAVGAAIVLAVAIGVPVYCYLQNRKRNNYERV